MHRMRQALAVAIALGFGIASMASADRQNPSSGDRQIPSTTPNKEETATTPLRGKVLKMENERVEIEQAPGVKTHIYVEKSTKTDNNYMPQEGDWIQADVTRDMHATHINRASREGYTIEGRLLRIEGKDYVIEDAGRGRELRLNAANDAKLDNDIKAGQRVEAEYTPDGKIILMKPARTPRPELGLGG